MLILSGRAGSRVQVKLPDGRVGWVVVTEVLQKTVRLGFDLPPDVKVMREALVAAGPSAGAEPE